jgi:hypothetical protein
VDKSVEKKLAFQVASVTRFLYHYCMNEKPEQPEDHESKCPCAECESWAWALLAWEDRELQQGRNPWTGCKL